MKSKAILLWFLGISFVVAILITLIWFTPLKDFFVDQNQLLTWLSSYGEWAPVITIGLHILQVITAPIPGTAIDAVNGLLFGPWLGTVYSMTGLMIGSMVVMSAIRKFGKPLAERFIQQESFDKLNINVQKYGRVFIFLFFLMPFLPDDVICIIAGLTSIPLLELFLLALVGRTPGVFVANWLGSQTAGMTIHQWIFIGIAGLLMIAIFWRFRETFSKKMMQVTTKISDLLVKKH